MFISHDCNANEKTEYQELFFSLLRERDYKQVQQAIESNLIIVRPLSYKIMELLISDKSDEALSLFKVLLDYNPWIEDFLCLLFHYDAAAYLEIMLDRDKLDIDLITYITQWSFRERKWSLINILQDWNIISPQRFYIISADTIADIQLYQEYGLDILQNNLKIYRSALLHGSQQVITYIHREIEDAQQNFDQQLEPAATESLNEQAFIGLREWLACQAPSNSSWLTHELIGEFITHIAHLQGQKTCFINNKPLEIFFKNWKIILFHLDAKHIREELAKCTTRFVIHYVRLKEEKSIAHANLIIIDQEHKTFELFEPNGINIPFQIDQFFRTTYNEAVFLDKTYKYIPASDYCILLNTNPNIYTYDNVGYCVAFVAMYGLLRVLNPQHSQQNIIQYISLLIQQDHTTILRFITLIEHFTPCYYIKLAKIYEQEAAITK